MLWRLEYYLEGMEEENSLNVLRQLQTELQSVKSMHDLFALEAYCTISSRLIGWIKRLELHEELAFRVGTLNLYNVSMHANWQDAFGYLRHVAESIFSLKNQSVEKQTEDVVNQVKSTLWSIWTATPPCTTWRSRYISARNICCGFSRKRRDYHPSVYQ